jgi:hypothetical protein
LVFLASIPDKGFTGFIMEVIGRRWTNRVPCRIDSRASADGDGAFCGGPRDRRIRGRSANHRFHRAVDVPAVPVHLSEQFPTALRGRGQYFGEASGQVAAGVLAPFLLEPYTGSPVVFFGTLLVVALIGAFVPVLFGKETVGQLEMVTEGVSELS